MSELEATECCFVLWAEDDVFACPCLEQRFIVDDISALRDILGDDAGADPCLRSKMFWLDHNQLQLMVTRFGVGIAFEAYETIGLAAPHSMRAAPYLVHTDFELFLMSEGRKPLAVFSECCPSDRFDDDLSPFDPFVKDGVFVRRVIDEPFTSDPTRVVRTVFFALPGQEWRIDAYQELERFGRLSGWNEECERRQGELLGYEQWQVEWWMKQWRERRSEIAAA